jgi:FKBP-type peptidyl-prolyl cis-trans isomerase FkpA
MKKYLLLPLILAVGIGILVLITSESPGTGKDAQADTFPNKDEDGYVTTDAGLRYKDVKVGEGKEAKTGDRVVVYYTGWLTDGTKFDSARDRKEPYELTIGRGVIKGWSLGIPGMKVGGKRTLDIPSSLAYGEEGRPPKIPPDAELIFSVELLEIK